MKKLFFGTIGALSLIFTISSSIATPTSDLKSEDFRRVCAHVTLECGVSGDLCGENQANFERNLDWAIDYWCNGGRQSLL
ncbi:hypothetical protein QYS48_32680 [Marivirga arenosa]|uniref:Uncharacterized protein n=1 Tax=Marivirga arenosa TaxID=3059076 RepID=A0AA51N542_9BACT|nr:hypothetical protein [Marivirga sp. ABR2-2]WMN06476.1 hypothetical protein QYS48_32680 [Marivirga sp. ABR2-2]